MWPGKSGIAEERGAAGKDLLIGGLHVAAAERPNVLLLCVDDGDSLASASLFLHDRRCAYHVTGGNDPDYRGTFSGTLLFMENVRRAIERGAQAVDVVGMNSPARGSFKSSCNAAVVPYFVATWASGETATIQTDGTEH